MALFRRETPHLVPKLWSNFIFLLYLLNSNTSRFQLKRLKTLDYGRSRLGGLPIFEPPIFARFSLFLISTHSENSIHLPLTVKKFKILAAVSGKLPHFGNPKFCQMLSSLHIYLHQKFRVPSMSGKKFQFRLPCLRGKTQFWDSQICSNFPFSYIHFTSTIHVSSFKG